MQQPDALTLLFDAFPDSVMLLDKSGRIVDVNPQAISLFGYSKKDLLGRSINVLYQTNYFFPKIIQETLTHQKKWVNETGFIRKNGTRGICKTQVQLLSHSINKAAAVVTHHNLVEYKEKEIAATKALAQLQEKYQNQIDLIYCFQYCLIKSYKTKTQLEKVLKDSNLRFHLFAENVTDIISQHAADGMIRYISPAAQILGYTTANLMGTNFYKYIHYDDIKKLKKAFGRRTQQSDKQYIVKYRIRRKEGDYRWFESNIRCIYDDNKMIQEIQMASRDITDRILDKKARLRGQQLARVFRLSTMEEMASGMAHEINQPLAAIVNYTQGCVRYLQQNQYNTDQIIEIMKKAVAQAERAAEVLHRLKNFFCKGKLLKSPCKVNRLIRDTVSLIRHDLNNAKTKIDFELGNLPIIFADRIQLQQVLLNVINNAVEAIIEHENKHRKIHIKTISNDINKIEIMFKDSGPGFSKEIINKVCKPFYTTKAHGSGMGLAICRSIIEAHGGEFIINPNSNATSGIHIILPIN